MIRKRLSKLGGEPAQSGRLQAQTAQTGRSFCLESCTLTHDNDDDGILDLIEVFEDKFAELTEISQRIATATEDLGQKMANKTAEMEALQRDSLGNANRDEAKRLITEASSDLTHYTECIEEELPLFSDAMNTGMNSFTKAAAMSVDLTADSNDALQAEEGLNAVVALRRELAETKVSMSQFRATVAVLPRMTTRLNKAKRGVLSALDRLLSEFAKSEVLLEESEITIRDLLQ